MNKFDVTIWGRNFNLLCVLQKYPGIDTTEKQNKCLDSILSINFDESLDVVKQYVLDKNGSEIADTKISNIFKFVMPNHIYVPRSNDCLVALMCDYRFDNEHGIAVVFVDGKIKKVCIQDEVL